jgi:alanyl-tRNA synthetase
LQQHNSKGVVASEWASEVAKTVGGKAGGKGPTSLGSGTNADKVDDGVEAARHFLEKFQI